ncbi:EthD family reductase [Bosea sp. (in: a-proteobacteria)]|jgi:uncharacterized protein (TIGR02118 family)|uniref:EthD family reductase n=1 Tax=Bosea sp. (in: a-proteobacteria) TaxID=1871050 RepID=UPI002DDD4514|nr:EthD family reductase [Bosea sp. (in: a-proteobacteria)]HEV2512084.1 EthD family reductase [Bosea sp. (in: a-proteobacteria)]
MIKLVTFQKRVEQLTRPAFEERWETIHGPIAAAFPGLRGYMLGFSLDEGEPPADGVAQLWFDTREACQASYGSEIGRNGSKDASAWLARREHLLASERWLKRAGSLSSTPFKLLLCLKRAPHQSRAAFLERLAAVVKPGLCDLTGASQARLSLDEAGQLLNSKVEGDLMLVTGEAPYDALVELWFTERNAAAQGRDRLRAWKDQVFGRDEIARWEDALLREHVVVMPPPPAFGVQEGQI